MSRVRVELPAVSARGYDVTIGRGVLTELASELESASSVVVVSDDRVGPLWRDRVECAIGRVAGWVEVPSGESYKTLDTVRSVWEAFEEHGVDRHSMVVDFGGGVVGDLGGFAAASFLRGIEFVQVPTTLLAQVDASVGGKVGVDFRGAKNRLGAFAQPRRVIVDLDTLSTLDPGIYRAGFAEVLKHGLIRDRAYFERVPATLAGDYGGAELEAVVRRSVEIKAHVVGQDPQESGPRKILNFGHTAGHAIESESWGGERPLLHGEAVAIGMVIASRISERVGLLDSESCARIEARVAEFGLPHRIPAEVDLGKVRARLGEDKKSRGGVIGWTLLRSIGDAVFDHRVEMSIVGDAMESCRA